MIVVFKQKEYCLPPAVAGQDEYTELTIFHTVAPALSKRIYCSPFTPSSYYAVQHEVLTIPRYREMPKLKALPLPPFMRAAR